MKTTFSGVNPIIVTSLRAIRLKKAFNQCVLRACNIHKSYNKKIELSNKPRNKPNKANELKTNLSLSWYCASTTNVCSRSMENILGVKNKWKLIIKIETIQPRSTLEIGYKMLPPFYWTICERSSGTASGRSHMAATLFMTLTPSLLAGTFVTQPLRFPKRQLKILLFPLVKEVTKQRLERVCGRLQF